MKTYNIQFSVENGSENLENEITNLIRSYLSANRAEEDFEVSLSDVTFLSVYSKNNNKITKNIPQRDIIYIEKDGYYSLVVTRFETYRIRMSLTRLMEKLDPNLFYQCHQGYIVNINEIKSMNEESITLIPDNKTVPMSRRRKRRRPGNVYFS